jgi:site-specific recombinase XerD
MDHKKVGIDCSEDTIERLRQRLRDAGIPQSPTPVAPVSPMVSSPMVSSPLVKRNRVEKYLDPKVNTIVATKKDLTLNTQSHSLKKESDSDSDSDNFNDSIESFSSDEENDVVERAKKVERVSNNKGSSKRGKKDQRGSDVKGINIYATQALSSSEDSSNDGNVSGMIRGTSGNDLVSGKSLATSGKQKINTSGKGTYQTFMTGNNQYTSGKQNTNTSGKLHDTSGNQKNTKKPQRRPWEDDTTDEWLLDGKSNETIRKYRGHIDDLYHFVIEHYEQLSEEKWYTQITYLHLLAWRKHIIANASKSTKQPRVAAVKSLFKSLVQGRHLSDNPAQNLRMPSKPPTSKVVRYLTKEQVAQTFDKATKQKDVGLIVGCYYAMLRVKEVRKLKRESCTFVQETDGTELLRLHVIGKGRDEKERDVTLGVKGTELLKPIILATAKGSYVFPGNDGALSSRQTGRRIKNVFKKASLPKASAHWLRHAGASHAHDNGATLVQLRDILGHSDVKVTSRYLHSDPGSAAARALDENDDSEDDEDMEQVAISSNNQQKIDSIIDLFRNGDITKEEMMKMMADA